MRGSFQLPLLAFCGLLSVPMHMSATVSAARFDSTNFTIDASSIGNSVNGPQSSTNYTLTSSGGESAVGNGASGSYKLGYGYVAQLENSMKLNVQPSGLVAYYPLDESAGNFFYDNSSNAVTATGSAGPVRSTGKVGGGVTLSTASANSITIPNSSPAMIAGPYTVSMWVKMAAVPTSNALILTKQASASSRNYFMFINTSGIFCGSFSLAGVNGNYCSGTNVTDGQWHHVAYTFSGTQVKTYVDGLLKTTTNISGTPDTQTNSIIIGNSGTVNGDVDEIKIYNRALSDKEMKSEFDAQNIGVPAGLGLSIVQGASSTSNFDVITQTDASGYGLMINQNNNLTSGGNTIPAISGSIDTPATWNETVTKGLGFTLYGTNATAIDGKWGTGSNYAAIPNAATSFYSRSGYSGGTKDVLNMRLRLDVVASQAVGDYTNQMTVTATANP